MMRGPGPRGRGDGRKAKDVKGTLKRLFTYVAQYKARLLLVMLCIVGNTVASVAGSAFIRTLIDDHITPMVAAAAPDFSGLAWALARMACVLLVGILCGFAQSRLMVTVSQGVLKKVRDDMFAHMQTLPIRYFDTHTYGSVMSHYTNDTDTLRMLIGQSLPSVLLLILL